MVKVVGRVVGLCTVLATMGAWASGTGGNHKADGTNVWIGAASGGSMKDLANWKAVVGGVEYTDATSVSNLFVKHVYLDLCGLANGAVITNDITWGNTYKERESGSYTMLAGLTIGGEAGDTWTILQANGGKGLFFCQPSTVTVTGGALRWSDSASGNYPYKALRKYGNGKLVFVKTPNFWENEAHVYEGVVAFTNGTGTQTFRWKISNGARIDIEKGVSSIAQVSTPSGGDSTAVLNINADAMLKFSTGFNNYGSGYHFYGDLTGSGILQVTGGGVHYLRRGTVNPLSFTGLYQAHLGDLEFGTAATPVGIQPTAGLDIDGAGNLRFYDNQTVATLSGEGADGGVVVPAGKVLTVTGPASGATNTAYAGRIVGGDFVKQGADYRLVLSGANIYAGETRVDAGTLALDRGCYRKGLRAYWNFEDPDDMGADVSADGLMRLAVRKDNLSYRPSLVEDGVVGRAVQFGDPASMARGGMFVRAHARDLDADAVLPYSSMPFTFSFWMRPTKGRCGNGTNFIHVDSRDTSSTAATVTTEEDVVFNNISWGAGFYFGSVRRDEEASTPELSAFQNLGFYCGVGWTRSGVWNDAGTSKANEGKVAIAKFEDPDYLFDGKWHHIVGTYSNRVIRIFVDGVKMDERVRGADLGVTSNPYLQLGNFSGDTIHTYQGGLDEVQWLAGAWSEEEVMAEYQAKKSASRDALLPQPVAHWTFDTQNADKSFPDVTGHGYDLENVASNGTIFVEQEAVSYKDDPSVTGYAARIKAKQSYLKLKDGVTFTDRMKEGTSFTVAIRCGYPADKVVFTFGDGTTENSVRLSDGGCPRIQKWYVGDSTERKMSDSGTYGSGTSFLQSAYCMDIFVYDADRKTVRIYRDSQLVYRQDKKAFTLKPTMLQWGRSGENYLVNLRLDDLRIYDEALTAAQVAALARTVRYGGTIGDAAALAMPVIPTNSPVTVASGATLEATGAVDHPVKSLAGAGTVKVRGAATFHAGSYTDFTGTVTGSGRLLVEKGQTVPLTAAQIEADVGFQDDTIVVAGATKDTPCVKTSGRVVLPRAGTLELSDATSAGSFAGKRFLVAECASAVIPSDLSGWTFSPLGDNMPELSFKLTDGKLYACCSGGGTILLVR